MIVSEHFAAHAFARRNGPVVCRLDLLQVLPPPHLVGREPLEGRVAAGRIKLSVSVEAVVAAHAYIVPAERIGILAVERILLIGELVKAHTLGLVGETGRVGFLEGVVLEGDYEFLPRKVDTAQGEGRVAIRHLVGLLIVGAVEQRERKIILGLGDLEQRGVGDDDSRVAAVHCMVVHLHLIHHAGLVVAALHAEHVALDTVVECSRRNLDFALCTGDIVAKSEYLVVGLGHQVVAHEEGSDADNRGSDDERSNEPSERYAGCLDGHKLFVFAHLADDHH